ncbi:MAG: diiron oxygenase [Acidobacteria bacterium]|nr:diiron oxygenase [Acidobacteriota bacterium]
MRASEKLKDTVESLSEKSRAAFYEPQESIDFPASVRVGEEWFTSPELISLYGTEPWEGLDEKQRKRLSFYEAVNFYSLNIHGERMLMEGLANRLYNPELRDVAEYLHHFLDEENKHMWIFGTFCVNYAGTIYPDRKVSFPRKYAKGEEHVLFFTRVMIFEEIVDYFNRKMAVDERLNETAREINRIHHADESRHLIFGRRVLAELVDAFRDEWPEETLIGIDEYVRGYFRVVWREYYNRDIYRDAAIVEADELPKRLLEDDEAPRELRQTISKGPVDYLLKLELIRERPSL